MAPFSLSRATPADMSELANLMYRSFKPWTVARFMGCFSESDLPKFISKFQRIMLEDPSDIWVKVTDNQTGKIAAATNWKLYLCGDKVQPRVNMEVPEWLDEEWKVKSEELCGPSNEARLRLNPDPFLHLNICFTSADYRRRGAGAMMMQWANDLADSLFLPCWVEASVDGTGLYSAAGYYTVEVIQLGNPEGFTVNGMRRDARKKAIEGGKELVNGT